MSEIAARVLATAVAVYASAGVVFAVAFVAAGVGRLDPRAADARWDFRVLILPGTVLFWPLLAYRWWRALRIPS